MRRFGLPLLAAAVWTAVVGASLTWNIINVREQTMAQARAEAVANYQKDISFRRWATAHGGVYVPITATQKSVPWLAHVPGRDVVTRDGRALTLLNPASMLRQIMDRYSADYGVRGRITGLKYLNPDNAPDTWEREQLEAFDRGERHEVWAVANMDGEPHLRYLHAMYMEPGCEKCHAILGYKPGDLRGATGVNLPLEGFLTTIGDSTRNLALSHGGIWLIGLIGIGWATRRQQRHTAERQAMTAILQQDEERFDLAVDGAQVGIWDMNLVTGEMFHTPRMSAMLGYSSTELPADIEAWRKVIHPEDCERVMERYRAHLADPGAPFEAVFRARHASGDWAWIMSRGRAVRDAHGVAVRMVGTHTDITAQKQLEAQLFEEKERAQVTLTSIGDAVLTCDREGNITFMNPMAESLCGWTREEALGLPVETVVPVYDQRTRTPLEGPVGRCLRLGTRVGVAEHTLLIDRGGREIEIDDSAAPIRDGAGHPVGAVMVFRDVTQSRELTRQMSWQLTHDALTGLISRREFERRLAAMVEDARSGGGEHALLFLDLDQFKVVNDTSGHLAGDELLKQLAFLLSEQMRRNDILGRLGGDEFAALLEHCPADKAREIAEKLRMTVADFRFIWQDKTFDIGVSIGLSMIDRDTAHAQEAMRTADVACYAAKEKGRNRVEVYHPEADDASSRRGERKLLSEIRQALTRDRFVLYAQEIRDARDPRPSYEVLVRLADTQGNLVAPDAFIAVAERHGLMPQVDRWIIEHALAALAASGSEARLSINLSGLSLAEDGMFEFIRERIAHHQIDAHRLTFEITETAAVSHLARGVQFMRELAKSGCRFALDDFGSGMSSFAYLKNLPVQVLKIDGSFVRDMLDDPVDRAFVEAIHRIGQLMGMRTVAEFVESEALIEVLREIGVDSVQGYAIARPRPLESVLAGL